MPASVGAHSVRPALGGVGGALHLGGGSRPDMRQVRSLLASGGLVLFGAEGQRFVQLGLFIFGFFCQLRRERVLACIACMM